jgi:hypothetical protein
MNKCQRLPHLVLIGFLLIGLPGSASLAMSQKTTALNIAPLQQGEAFTATFSYKNLKEISDIEDSRERRLAEADPKLISVTVSHATNGFAIRRTWNTGRTTEGYVFEGLHIENSPTGKETDMHATRASLRPGNDKSGEEYFKLLRLTRVDGSYPTMEIPEIKVQTNEGMNAVLLLDTETFRPVEVRGAIFRITFLYHQAAPQTISLPPCFAKMHDYFIRNADDEESDTTSDGL